MKFWLNRNSSQLRGSYHKRGVRSWENWGKQPSFSSIGSYLMTKRYSVLQCRRCLEKTLKCKKLRLRTTSSRYKERCSHKCKNELITRMNQCILLHGRIPMASIYSLRPLETTINTLSSNSMMQPHWLAPGRIHLWRPLQWRRELKSWTIVLKGKLRIFQLTRTFFQLINKIPELNHHPIKSATSLDLQADPFI